MLVIFLALTLFSEYRKVFMANPIAVMSLMFSSQPSSAADRRS